MLWPVVLKFSFCFKEFWDLAIIQAATFTKHPAISKILHPPLRAADPQHTNNVGLLFYKQRRPVYKSGSEALSIGACYTFALEATLIRADKRTVGL